jgi:guanylate kinase
MSFETGQIITFVGQSGSGKTTQIGELIKEPGFRLLPSTTTRPPRSTDLLLEYRYKDITEYERIAAIPGRFLWDVVTGDGDRYAKDADDVSAALADTQNIYTHALTPGCADILLKKYGPKVVRTVLLPSPGDDVLIDRMITRGDAAENAAGRLISEQRDDWLAQSIAIEGLYVVKSQTIEKRHEEILDFIAV